MFDGGDASPDAPVGGSFAGGGGGSAGMPGTGGGGAAGSASAGSGGGGATGSAGAQGGAGGSASAGQGGGSLATGGAGGAIATGGAVSSGGAKGGGGAGGGATGGGGGSGAGGAQPGGRGGAGGATCPDLPATDMLISDFERGAAISACTGCSGYWYAVNDGTGTQVPAAASLSNFPLTLDSGACGSLYALETSGTGFKEWAALGVDLNQRGTSKSSYDVSGYSGVAFRARTASGTSSLVVLVPDVYSDPSGGKCLTGPDAGTGNSCYDAFKTPNPLTVTSQWTDFTVKFSTLQTEGWGLAAPGGHLDVSQIYGFQFRLVTTPQIPLTFDVLFDDVRLVK
jgi:hypothetical protein